MQTILNYGIAKTQKLPYSYLDLLKKIETRGQLVDFFMQDSYFFKKFLLKRTSNSKVQDIFEKGRICDDSEFDYLCEATKSAIFRAGGSNIMNWGCWYVGNSTLKANKISEEETEKINVYNSLVELPLGFSIAIPRKLYEDMKEVSNKIHKEIRSHIDGSKILSRVDYVIINENKAYIIDIGESNTTLSLSDALYNFSGLGKGTLLEEYFKRVIEEQEILVPNFQNLIFVAEDKKMLQNLPYEFEIMQSFVKDKYGLNTTTILKDKLLSHHEEGTALVRCFRGLLPQNDKGIVMVDDISAINIYKKDNLFEILERLKADFPLSISIPSHHLFELKGKEPEELAKNIHQHAKDAGLEDYVVKPSVKSNKGSSLAFLYSINNPTHLRQLKKTVKRLSQEEHIPSLILEENVGSGIIDGKKLEVRVHCLSD